MLLRWLIHNLVVPAVKERVIEGVQREAQAPDSTRDGPLPELPPCEVAILFGSGIEAEGTVTKLNRDTPRQLGPHRVHTGIFAKRSVILAECGANARAAAESTQALLAAERPAWVVSAGFAAGLTDDLRRGHIVMPDRLASEDGVELDVGFRISPEVVAESRGLHVGRLVSVERIVRTPEERKELASRYNAIACDAETMAIAKVCRDHKARFLAVRVISDAVDDRLPPDVEALMGQASLAGKLGAAAGALFKRPGSVQDLWRMRDAGMKASDRLAKFLAGVVPQLT